jgi:hypothetical protein
MSCKAVLFNLLTDIIFYIPCLRPLQSSSTVLLKKLQITN